MENVTKITNDPQNSKPDPGSPMWLTLTYRTILDSRGEEAADRWMKDEGRRAVEAFRERQDAAKAALRAAQKAASRDGARPGASNIPDMNPSGQGESLSGDIDKAINRAPVDKTRTPAVRADNIEDTLKIFQPKSVIFGKYMLTEWQENILTLIMEQLQGYMSKSLTALKPDILGEISVRIDCSKFAGDDKAQALQQIERLMEYKFEFWWNSKDVPPGTKKVETKGLIISTYHNYVGTSFVDITINKWAFPFLLYFGKSVGANQYLKRSALSIPGKYAKRLYKILSGYIDLGRFDYNIATMREEFLIPPSYRNAQIKKYIVDPSVAAINDFGEFRVTAEFVTLSGANRKTKPVADTVRFTIEGTPARTAAPSGPLPDEDIMEHETVTALAPLLEEPYRSRIGAIAREWRMKGDIAFVHGKIRYYRELVRNGRMTPLKMKNYLLKAISDETHTTLRKSTKHRAQEDPDPGLFG